MNPNKNIQVRQDLLSILFFCVLILAAFSTRWIKGETMFFEVIWDPIPLYFSYPGDQLAIDTFRAGQYPAWDPFRGLGNSQIFLSGGSLFYPLKVIAYVFNSIAGWEIYLLLRFLMAGFFTYLFARGIKLGWAAATLSGMAFMLCGYFREFHNFVNLNIETLFPIGILIVFRFLKTPKLMLFLAYIVVAMWLGTGVQPEASFFTCVYGYIFFVFACILHVRLMPDYFSALMKRIVPIILLSIPIYLIGGYALLPFIEYLGRSWNYHFLEIGQLHVEMKNVIALITPVFDYWMPTSSSDLPEELRQFTLLPGYLGYFISGMVMIAFINLRRLPSIGLFFAVAFIFYFGIIFYLPGFSLINHLPLFKDMQNFRYLQPYLAFSAAILAGFALDMISKREIRLHIVIFPFAIILIWIAGEAWLFRHQLLHSAVVGQAAALFAVSALAAGAALLIARKLSWLRSTGKFITTAIMILASFELLTYFIMVYPLFGKEAFRIMPPPPYVEFLRSRPGIFRTYGLEPELLHPNLSGLYKIADIREQTALYPKDYVTLFSAANGLDSHSDRVGHFLEKGKFYFDLDMGRAPTGFVRLINLRYLLKSTGLNTIPVESESNLASITAPDPRFFSNTGIEIDGRKRKASFLHAPSRIEMKMKSVEATTLNLDIGIMESAWDAEGFDGACLSAFAISGKSSAVAFFRFINPKARKEERKWISLDVALPLSDNLLLALVSTPGPKDNIKNDYTLYGDIGFALKDPIPGFKLIYDRDCRIYENQSALERAFWVPRAEYLPSNEKILARMLEKDFDPEAAVLLAGDREDEPPATAARGKVKIEGYDFGRARIRVEADSAGWLVLSDMWFPGWRAEIDGNETRIHRAYFLFRTVKVPAGDHEVLFTYYPWSTRMGIWFSIIGTFMIPTLLLLKKSRKFRPKKQDS